MPSGRKVVLNGLVPVLILFLVSAVLGCGAKSSLSNDSAGTAEQLVNTSWTTGQGTLQFKAQGKVSFQSGGNASEGTYLVSPDGVVRIFGVAPMPMAGTWDGTTLTLMGQKLTRE